MSFKKKSNVLSENTEAEIKILNPEKKLPFKIDFRAYGKSIFQNLVLTVNAFSNSNEDLQTPIPIKCAWKRVKNNEEIYIQDVTTNSYIPTAEDIGYIIEVEINPYDGIGIEGSENTAFAQYGPVKLTSDVKNTLEMILTQGQSKFLCFLYNLEDQSKVPDKQIELILNYDELRLVEITQKDTKELERIKYSKNNPLIKLNALDSSRFYLKFYEGDFFVKNEKNLISDTFNIKLKSEYNLIAMSKNQRELLYLVLQCFVIDERIKNSKLFSNLNYKTLPDDLKNGVIDLITEIKNVNEENSILLHNSKFYQVENYRLKKELKELEDDFQFTMEQINNTNLKLDLNVNQSNKGNEINLNKNKDKEKEIKESNIELKKQIEELKTINSSSISKEKAIREELKKFKIDYEIINNKYENLINELNGAIKTQSDKDGEIQSLKKANLYLSELNNRNNEVINEITENNRKNELLIIDLNKKLSSDYSENTKIELTNLKADCFELKARYDEAIHENQQLKVQINVFKNQKDQIAKELNLLIKDKEDLRKINEELKDQIKTKDSVLAKQQEDLKNYKSKNDKFIKELYESEQKYQVLLVEKNNIANAIYDGNQNIKSNTTSLLDESVYKIGRDEYEEYNNYQREKDELEGIIMCLKSNNEAHKIEIDSLKNQLVLHKEKTDNYNKEKENYFKEIKYLNDIINEKENEIRTLINK